MPKPLQLEDDAAAEKISEVPQRLSTAGAPPGTDADTGDIGLNASWNNLAIFYRSHGYATGLIKMGQLDDSSNLPQNHSYSATFSVTLSGMEIRKNENCYYWIRKGGGHCMQE